MYLFFTFLCYYLFYFDINHEKKSSSFANIKQLSYRSTHQAEALSQNYLFCTISGTRKKQTNKNKQSCRQS